MIEKGKGKMTETIHNINETERLRAVICTHNWELPEILGDGWNVFTIANADRLSPINYGSLTDELEKIAERFVHYDYETKIHALKLFFAIKGIANKAISLRGYSQGEWHDIIIYNDNAGDSAEWMNDADAIDPLRAWYRGDIFDVIAEKLVIYTQLQTGATVEQWEEIDRLGGVILTDNFTLANLTGELTFA